MSQQQFSIYELATGRLTGAMVTASSSETMDIILESTVPDGCSIVLGWWEHTRHAVDLQTGTVIEIAPPEPDWRDQQARAASAAYAEIVAAESMQARPVREIVDSLVSGSPPPEEAVARIAGHQGQDRCCTYQVPVDSCRGDGSRTVAGLELSRDVSTG